MGLSPFSEQHKAWSIRVTWTRCWARFSVNALAQPLKRCFLVSGLGLGSESQRN